jgi:hypothetical protein
MVWCGREISESCQLKSNKSFNGCAVSFGHSFTFHVMAVIMPLKLERENFLVGPGATTHFFSVINFKLGLNDSDDA